MASVRVLTLLFSISRFASPRLARLAHLVVISPTPPLPPLTQFIVYIARVIGGALVSGPFAELEALSSDSVARLAKRACTEFPLWNVDASQVELFLAAAPDGVNEPSADAIKDALSGERLQSSWPLEHARIRPGSWLLVRVPPPPAAAPGASQRRAGGSRALSLTPPVHSPHVYQPLRWVHLMTWLVL
jgi:hypothetical protein